MSRIFFFIFSFLDFFLPSYLESEFFPEIAGGFGVSGFSCRVRKTGFFRSDLGSIKIWNRDETYFTVESVRMEGISASCTIPELINMRSSGLQRFSFDRASFGKTELDNGEIIFNIESGDSIFIEKISAEYCRGKVFTHAVRISSKKSDYNLILFFDRLNLAMILENLGIEKSEGEGAVNGRLPVMFNNGQIIFGDGFLYSTPGVGGNIRLTGTQVLTSGIPEGTVQHAQLELAREALKDYKYEWVKLSLVTKGENLLLKMQLAGKPAGLPPFVYKKDFGGFVKIEGKGEGSVFQGIGIDVNFSLPLKRLMKYGENINSLFDLIRKPGE